MTDCEPMCVSKQVFNAGRDDRKLPETGFPFGIPPPDPPRDWHRADIIAAIKKTGTTIRALSRLHGMSPNTLANTLTRKWPRGEKLISAHLRVPPWTIWPSRYPELYEAMRTYAPKKTVNDGGGG